MGGFSEYKNDEGIKAALLEDVKEILAGIALAAILVGMVVWSFAVLP
jgi:hypothetical protein